MAVINDGNGCVGCQGSFRNCLWCDRQEDEYLVQCDRCESTIDDYVYEVDDDLIYDKDCLYKEMQSLCKEDVSNMEIEELEEACDVTIRKYTVDDYFSRYYDLYL